MSRPELTTFSDASLFYNKKEAKKYDSSSRMINVQREITERAIELLKLPQDKKSYILDIGCGSGLSGQVLSEHGHVWVGCDVSRDMLSVANERRIRNNKDDDDDAKMMSDDSDSDDDDSKNNVMAGGDLLHHDMGTGLPFKPSTFDAVISISAIQWLCYSSSKKQIPKIRLRRFFSSLYQILRRGGRAVLQFYPETSDQIILISETATSVGFAGGIVVDYPNSTKAKKHYLVLSFDRNTNKSNNSNGVTPDGSLITTTVGRTSKQKSVQVDSSSNVVNMKHRGGDTKRLPKKRKGGKKTKEWILHKKEVQRKKNASGAGDGKKVRPDTKYTGRKRPTKF